MENNNLTLKKCNINTDSKIITVELMTNNNVTKTVYINVGDEKNDESILNFIDEANRHYSATLFNIQQTNNHSSYGCLTSKVVGLEDIPITFLNPKYIINVFLKLFQSIMKDDIYYLKNCTRDETLNIPTSEENLSSLVNRLMNIYNENRINSGNDDDDEESIIDIKDMFMILLEYIVKLQTNNNNNLQKKLNLHKKATLMGGISHLDSLQDSLKDNFNETLVQTGENIHRLIYEHKGDIYNNQICKNDVDNVKAFIDANPNLELYKNVNVTFKFMMKTIGNIFNVLFLNILPQKSMLDCLYATLYQAAFLNELDILQYYSKIIQLPLMFRLIYSFYKDERKQPPHAVNEKICKLIEKLCRNGGDDKDIDAICEIAVRLDFKNIEELNSIYWLLNEKRNFTYEFYIIIIIGLYVLSKCKGMNKDNAKLNAKIFGSPIYDLLYTFRQYIVNDIKDLQVASMLCTDTFDNFNKLYSKDINKCLKTFLHTIHK